MKQTKKFWLAVILIILIACNPSLKTFMDYVGNDNKEYVRREVNLFVLSIYKDGGNPEEYYIGVMGNFIKVYTKWH